MDWIQEILDKYALMKPYVEEQNEIEKTFNENLELDSDAFNKVFDSYYEQAEKIFNEQKEIEATEVPRFTKRDEEPEREEEPRTADEEPNADEEKVIFNVYYKKGEGKGEWQKPEKIELFDGETFDEKHAFFTVRIDEEKGKKVVVFESEADNFYVFDKKIPKGKNTSRLSAFEYDLLIARGTTPEGKKIGTGIYIYAKNEIKSFAERQEEGDTSLNDLRKRLTDIFKTTNIDEQLDDTFKEALAEKGIKETTRGELGKEILNAKRMYVHINMIRMLFHMLKSKPAEEIGKREAITIESFLKNYIEPDIFNSEVYNELFEFLKTRIKKLMKAHSFTDLTANQAKFKVYLSDLLKDRDLIRKTLRDFKEKADIDESSLAALGMLAKEPNHPGLFKVDIDRNAKSMKAIINSPKSRDRAKDLATKAIELTQAEMVGKTKIGTAWKTGMARGEAKAQELKERLFKTT